MVAEDQGDGAARVLGGGEHGGKGVTVRVSGIFHSFELRFSLFFLADSSGIFLSAWRWSFSLCGIRRASGGQ